MLTSVGDDTPLGTFYTPEKYRWRLMVNDTYTQYATRLTAGQGFLFHSITYASPNEMDLLTVGYNGREPFPRLHPSDLRERKMGLRQL